MPSRKGFGSVISAAKSQAAATGLRTVEESVAEPPPPAVEAAPVPESPAPEPTEARRKGDSEAINWVSDLRSERQGDILTVYGVPVLVPKGSEDETVTFSFRCPRWLREAVHARCRQYGVEAQEFGQAALAVILAQLEASD